MVVIGIYIGYEILFFGKIMESTLLTVSLLIGFIFSINLLTELSTRGLDDIVVKREVLDPLVEDQRVRVRITIENRSKIMVYRLLIRDHYPKLFQLIEGSPTRSTILPPDGVVTYTYVLKPVLGKHVFSRLELIVSDPFKLFNTKLEMNPEINTIYVKPRPMSLPSQIVVPWRSRGFGLGTTRLRGYGQVFYGLREYNYGDDYRFIDWKSYARLRKLFVKEYEREANLSIVFVIDATELSMRNVVGETPVEYMARMVAGLSRILIKRGDHVALTIRSGEIIRTGYGHGYLQYLNIINALSKIEWRPVKPAKLLGELLLDEAKKMPKRTKTIYFIFTSFLNEEEENSLKTSYQKLKSMGHLVYIVQLLPELFEGMRLTGLESGIYYGLIYKQLTYCREASKRLAKSGIYMVTAGPRDAFESIYRLLETYRLRVV